MLGEKICKQTKAIEYSDAFCVRLEESQQAKRFMMTHKTF